MNPSQHGICTTKATTSSFWSAFGSLLWSTRKAKPATAATRYAPWLNRRREYTERLPYPTGINISIPAHATNRTQSFNADQKDEQEHLRTKAKAIQLLSKDKTDCNCVPLWECLQQNVGGEMEMDVDQAMKTPAVKRECGELESQLRMCMVISREYVGQTGDLRE